MAQSKWRVGLRLAARSFALVATLLIVVELASFVTLRAMALRDRARPVPAETMPVYRDLPWAATYWREHKQFLAQEEEAYPYGSWRSRPFSGETINVDANGIRRTVGSQCERSTPTVYVFGGSTVWGYGSPDWETIPSHLAKRFADDGHPACVINFGNDAWRSDESVIALLRILKQPGAQPPTRAIFIDSCNDVFTPFLYTGRVDLPWNFHKEWIDALTLSRQGSFRYLRRTNTGVMAERLLRRIRPASLHLLPTDIDRTAREIVDNYVNNVRIVDGLARNFGFAYDFFWLPVPTQGQDPVFKRPVEKMLPLIRAASAGRFHDLSGLYDGHENIVVDTCHVLPEGHRMVADHVYETITKDSGRKDAGVGPVQ
jgi:lysophospholipase L1-like esterase